MDPSECVEHKGAIGSYGYGIKRYKYKQIGAHRLAYCIHNNIEPEAIKGLVIMHSCDNRLCINPDHLSLGTHASNRADAVSKGRQAKGSESGNSKLDEGQVMNIKRLILDGHTNVNISVRYGVSEMCISKIRTSKTWRHVDLSVIDDEVKS